MTELNRRNLIKYGSTALAAGMAYSGKANALGIVNTDGSGRSYIDDERIKRLSSIAVDAAVASGANYADVRLTYTQAMDQIGMGASSPVRSEILGIGVRALCGGYWGFSASPVWSDSEAARLGKAAAANAIANKSDLSVPIELSPLPSSAGGSWIMPAEINAFEVPYEEITDYIGGLTAYISRLEKVDPRSPRVIANCKIQDKYFFSSQGQYIYQRLYNTSASIGFLVRDQLGTAPAVIDFLTPAGVGFELLKNRTIRDRVYEYYEIALEERGFGVMPVDVGRYPVLMNRSIVAGLASQSIGMSTELDRALGHESNAGGTSFINSPDMLGNLSLASPLLNMTASRSEAGSVGKVEWDDEGVKPTSMQVIKDGKLVALQAPREGYSWLKEYHEKNNTQFVANGSMNSQSGIESPLVFSSDLTIDAGDSSNKSIDELREGIKDGIEFKTGDVSMDFQLSTGLAIGGIVFKITNGKRVARIMNSGTLFRTANLWKNVVDVGRKQDIQRFGIALNKGEPNQTCYHSVYSPHMVIKDMDVIDVTRRA